MDTELGRERLAELSNLEVKRGPREFLRHRFVVAYPANTAAVFFGRSDRVFLQRGLPSYFACDELLADCFCQCDGSLDRITRFFDREQDLCDFDFSTIELFSLGFKKLLDLFLG